MKRQKQKRKPSLRRIGHHFDNGDVLRFDTDQEPCNIVVSLPRGVSSGSSLSSPDPSDLIRLDALSAPKWPVRSSYLEAMRDLVLFGAAVYEEPQDPWVDALSDEQLNAIASAASRAHASYSEAVRDAFYRGFGLYAESPLILKSTDPGAI